MSILPGKKFFFPSAPPTPAPLPAIPKRTDTAKARDETRTAATARALQASTILTEQGLGVPGEPVTTRARLGSA